MDEQGTILHSKNGGTRWDIVESGSSVSLNQIIFTGDTTGWIIGDQGLILNTLNGGERWNVVESGTKADLNRIFFHVLNIGWIAGKEGTILYTEDSGVHWQVQETDAMLDLLSVCSCNDQICYAAGDRGILLKSVDGGNQWQTISSGFYSGSLHFGTFTSESHLWACGGTGEIFHSQDAGTTWASQGALPQFVGSYSDIEFTDADQGWYVHSRNWDAQNALLYSGDKGQTWDTGYFAENYWQTLCEISFVHPDTGWVGGMAITMDPMFGFLMKYVMLRTYSGGQSWNRKTFSKPNTIIFYSELWDMFFLDKSHGWAIGYSNGVDENTWDSYWTVEVLRTTNGGTSWQVIPVNTISLMIWPAKIYFVTKEVGWVYEQRSAELYKTYDSGSHWELMDYSGPGINDIYFSDSYNGWIVSYNGNILHTTDGGITWTYEKSPTNYNLHRIFFTETGDGWIYGDGSTILHLADTTTVGTEEFTMSQPLEIVVYPNPCNESALISYELEKPGVISLEIFSNTGQLVEVLVSEHQKEGTHKIQWDAEGLPAGVYFYTLTANGKQQTANGKVVVLK